MKKPSIRLTTALCAAALAMTLAARGDTYDLVNLGSSGSPVEFSDPSNWTVDGAAAATCPQSGDAIRFGTASQQYKAYLALDGDYTIQDLTQKYHAPYLYKSSNAAGNRVSLTITGSIGEGQYQYFYVYDGVTLLFPAGSTYNCAYWDGGAAKMEVYSGGIAEIRGSVLSRHMRYKIGSGGTMVFAPTSYSASNFADQYDSFTVESSGSLSFPNGLTVTGGNNSTQQIVQNGGTITFGGGFTSVSPWTYSWKAGTLAVNGSVSFGDNISVSVPDSASVTLNIASGATISIPALTYGTGVALTKTGAGDYVLPIAATQPSTLSVSDGSLVLASAGTFDLSSVAFASGTKIKLGASGIVLSVFDASIANATFGFAGGFTPASGATVLTCADAGVLAQAQTGLNAALAGTGVSVEVSGTSLVAESHYTFSSSSVTDMNDTAGWVGGFAAPAGQPATVSGASTAAVMGGTVPAYSSISVEDGASLTVAATRDLPAATLAAGTALSVAAADVSVVMESRSHSGYIMDTATLVGTMSPSRSLSEITDIVGIRGGGWFGERSNPYTYVNTKLLDDGARLHAQFIYNDSDYTKCAFVDFTKDAQGNIYATGVGAGYVSPTNETVDFDEVEYTAGTYGTSNTSGAYGVKNLSFKAPVSYGGPSTVTAVGDFETTGSGSVTVDVAADCVLDLSGVDVTTAATLVKTGDGAIIFGDELPTALNVSEGVLVLQPYVEYDMAATTVAGGVSVKVAVGGEYKDAIAFVQQNGNTVFMSSGVYVGVGTWATTANWVNAESPDASTAVHVHGASTVLTIDGDAITMPASISVEGGATLRVLADVTLPPLAIDSTSRVVFGDNETQPAIAATLNASLATIADATATPVALPTMEIATNATVTIGGDMKFKNIDLRLYGRISKSSTDVKGPTFGHAASGETSYIAFLSDGGDFNIHAATGSDATLGQILFLCPESGGTVVAVRPVTIRNSRHTINGWNDMGNVRFGYNNPTTEVFNVLIEGTHLDVSGNFNAGGAARISLANGSYIRRAASCLGHGFSMAISDAATVDVGEGCDIHFATGAGNFGIDSQSAVDAVTVRDGGIYSVTANSSGWNPAHAVFASDDGVLGVHGIYDSRERTDLLLGFASARLDGDLAIKSVDIYSDGGHYTNNVRHAKMANVPFTGTGDVVVTNGVPAYPFTVTMVNGANTATGSIKVAKVDGDAETALYFANGANWAGTVVAGNVALTNLTGGAASATFGILDLAADFPIRFWKTNDTVTSDTIKVDSFTGSAKLAFAAMDGELAPGDSFAIGQIRSGATLPKIARSFTISMGEPDGEGYCDLRVRYSRGMQIIFK